MNNTTLQEESQGLSPNEAAASLAFATSLMLPQQQQPTEGQQTPETAPQQEETPQADKQPEEKDPMKEMEMMFTTKLDEIRQELKADNQREIDTLKQTITDALSEDE